MFACMQVAFVYTSIRSCRPCVHTLFKFFFDNVSHDSERVPCVCVVKLMLCQTIKYWLATPLVELRSNNSKQRNETCPE